MTMRNVLTSLVFVTLLSMAALHALAATATVISFNGNQYSVELLSESSSEMWAYKVVEVAGKDLSHWGLNIPGCAGQILDTFPPATIGIDASTGYWLVKWDLQDDFTDGLFVVWLAGWPVEGSVDALAKAGAAYGVGQVAGPVCNLPTQQQDPGGTIPDPTNTPVGGTIPPATATSENGTIPPATDTPTDATPTNPATSTLVPPTVVVTIAPPTATTTTQPAVSPTATGTSPPATATSQPTATATVPGVDTPTATPTLTPTTHPDSGPVQWLPIVLDCAYNSHSYLECGR